MRMEDLGSWTVEDAMAAAGCWCYALYVGKVPNSVSGTDHCALFCGLAQNWFQSELLCDNNWMIRSQDCQPVGFLLLSYRKNLSSPGCQRLGWLSGHLHANDHNRNDDGNHANNNHRIPCRIPMIPWGGVCVCGGESIWSQLIRTVYKHNQRLVIWSCCNWHSGSNCHCVMQAVMATVHTLPCNIGADGISKKFSIPFKTECWTFIKRKYGLIRKIAIFPFQTTCGNLPLPLIHCVFSHLAN